MRWILFVLFLAGPVFSRELAPLAAEEANTTPTPALTIENWKPKKVDAPVPPEEIPPPPRPKNAILHEESKAVVPSESPSSPFTPVADVSAKPDPHAVQKKVTLVQMNEMKGVIARIDEENRTVRLSVEGGFNPQFDYDPKVVEVGIDGKLAPFSSLRRGDSVIIRYVGKDMIARQIEKLPK